MLKTSLLKDSDVYEQFSKAIVAEMHLYHAHYSHLKVATIFFGGGTPNILPTRDFERICAGLFKYFTVQKGIEMSVECNPELVSKEQLICYKACGVNRISLGCQTFHDPTLKALGRSASSQDIHKAYTLIRDHHYQNVNLDLMFGLSNIQGYSYSKDLKQALIMDPEHFSCYELTHSSPIFQNKVKQGGFPNQSEKKTLSDYQLTIKTLPKHGYTMYEVSNYAKPGYQCQHNTLYWKQKNYIGLGPSACGTLNNKRYTNIKNLKRYFHLISQKQFPRAHQETLTTSDQIKETIILSLRTKKGLHLPSLLSLIQKSPLTNLKHKQLLPIITHHITHKRLKKTGHYIHATQKGLYILDSITKSLI